MTYTTITFSIENQVAEIQLNRPDAANAMNLELMKEFAEVALKCDESEEVRAVLISGAGKMFSAGGDLQSFASEGDNLAPLLKDMTMYLHAAISRLSRMDAPLVVAANGMCAGAGLSLAAAGDMVIAGESAGFVMAYTAAGLSPDGSSTYFLPRRIGDRRTRELMLTNRRLSAAEALEWGLVNKVVPDTDLMEEARKLASQLASGPTKAYGQVKALLTASLENGLETQMELEARGIAAMSHTDDAKEGIDAFLNKRKPAFKGK